MGVEELKKEAEYFEIEQKKTIKEMTSAKWNELYAIQLRIAFRRGYNAGSWYQDKRKEPVK